MISSFTGDYRWLSNFWPVRITYLGHEYGSVEHAYQASKCADAGDWARFVGITAGEAKKLGRQVRMQADWEDVKLGIMLVLLRKKFARGTALVEKLLTTGEEVLVEGNTWGDRYWGQCPIGHGHNNLGKLLMQVRAELRQQ